MNRPALVALAALGLAAACAAPLRAENAVAGETYWHVGATPPPSGFPAIKSVSISTTQIRPGRPVTGHVETSENVRYVEARIDYRNVPLHEDGPGRFSLSYTVPWWLPPWLRHGYTLQIIARSVDGVETVRGHPGHRSLRAPFDELRVSSAWIVSSANAAWYARMSVTSGKRRSVRCSPSS